MENGFPTLIKIYLGVYLIPTTQLPMYVSS